MRRAAAILAALLALSAPAQAHAKPAPGRALLGAHALVEAQAACPAGVPVQALTVLDGANVRPWALAEVENAIVGQSLQLHAAWGTPCVTFGSGGWDVYLGVGYEPEPGGGATFQLGGEHYGDAYHGPFWAGQPYAVVDTGGTTYTGWSYAFSHEILEMLADPNVSTYATPVELREVCDPVENLTYRLDGVPVDDFVFPNYFTGGAGPWDEAGELAGPGAIQSSVTGGRRPPSVLLDGVELGEDALSFGGNGAEVR